LPGWLQTIAWGLPPTHVFEGMRALVIDGVFRGDLMASAIAINVAYIAGSLAVFIFAFERARERGQLLQTGE
jgi:ABC-2 type transport system permease protein